MPAVPPDLMPTPGERGVLSSQPDEAGRRAVDAWDAFIEQAARSDLGAKGRAKGRQGREVLLPLGRWPQTRSLAEILADAHAGRTTPAVDLEREERDVLAAQADASDVEVVDGLRRARDDLADFLASAGAGDERALTTASPLGPLPVLTLLHAVAYQLAVCASTSSRAGPRLRTSCWRGGWSRWSTRRARSRPGRESRGRSPRCCRERPGASAPATVTGVRRGSAAPADALPAPLWRPRRG